MFAFQVKIIALLLICPLVASQRPSNRSVLIFADKGDNVNAIQQINILKADPNGIKDRDIIFKVITYSESNMQHYKKWHIPNAPFTVILIGKDNGEKLRSHQPVTLARLFDLIDNMPMRQQEMKYKH
ncbi:DUF4174 domain-containing protein [Mucilaginibacter paludis]|uniref:DUF4174 domain-containing protein n=1 Tax=Mucilaginibacter paludis DSM 18603 TaxID=714943 RepID=H1Y9K7_9SPHI|nr:DUF4174 domain-containing protein [Mucilaginibacter paludis]EHQ30509.1 hypothetical protein Mucpa_6456 [Mucilaginibacter paludis DSM 18603]